MTGPAGYQFRAAGMGDLAMLRRWKAAPHVRQWWSAGEPFDADDLADRRVSRWIVSLDGQPFAFMQDYTVHGWAQHHFDHLPRGARGIDQYIGVADMIGRGHGTGFISQRLRALFAAGAPVVATDPHPDNARAIAAYRKCGFRVVGPAIETEWGVSLPMEARPPG